MRHILRLDLFPKTPDEHRVRTAEGGAISVCAVLCIIALFVSELSFWIGTQRVERLQVDDGRLGSLRVGFDITFARMSCDVISLSVMDDTGAVREDVRSDGVFRQRLREDGRPLGGKHGQSEHHALGGALKSEAGLRSAGAGADARRRLAAAASPAAEEGGGGNGGNGGGAGGGCGRCYGAGTAETRCCQTCDDVRAAYKRKGWALPADYAKFRQCAHEPYADVFAALGAAMQLEEEAEQEAARRRAVEVGAGCRIHGSLDVAKVKGSLSFSPSAAFQHAGAFMQVADLLSFTLRTFNVSHAIHRFDFGPPFPGLRSPLEGKGERALPGARGGLFQYFVQLVPTAFTHLNGTRVESNQYAVTDHVRLIDGDGDQGLPGVLFVFEPSPVKVIVEERRRGATQFLTSACAIVGGIFASLGMVDYAVHSSAATRKLRQWSLPSSSSAAGAGAGVQMGKIKGPSSAAAQ
jgi:hypothetical protein